MYLSERSLVIFLIISSIFVCWRILHQVHLMHVIGGEFGRNGNERDSCVGAVVGLLGGGNSVVQVSTSL
jgi:hypothetical protein